MLGPIPLIELENIEKVFLTDEVETQRLVDVAFEIRHGDYVSIAGPSGCGKFHAAGDPRLARFPSRGAYRLRGESSSIWTTPGAPACATARSASFSKAST